MDPENEEEREWGAQDEAGFVFDCYEHKPQIGRKNDAGNSDIC